MDCKTVKISLVWIQTQEKVFFFRKLTFGSLNLKYSKNSKFRLRCLVQHIQNVRTFLLYFILACIFNSLDDFLDIAEWKIYFKRRPLNLWKQRPFPPTAKNDLFITKHRSTATSKLQFFNLQFWTLKVHG